MQFLEAQCKGRGGPVARSMITNGIGWDVNCLPKGHELILEKIVKMKHLATIQKEFLKSARKWMDLTEDQQKAYLKRHPKSNKQVGSNKKRKGRMPVALARLHRNSIKG